MALALHPTAATAQTGVGACLLTDSGDCKQKTATECGTYRFLGAGTVCPGVITINPLTAARAVSGTIQFGANLISPAGVSAPATGVEWTSASPDIMRIASLGVGKAMAAGSTKIRASLPVSGGQKIWAESSVTVAPFKFSIAARPYMAPGSTQQLAASVTQPDSSVVNVNPGKVAWSSSQPGVIEVSASGVASAKSLGFAVLSGRYVTGDGAAHDATVAVNVADYEFTIRPANAVLRANGTAVYVGYLTRPDGSTVRITNSTAAWSSSNPGVASMAAGTVTGVAAGKASISAVFTPADGKPRTAVALLEVREPGLELNVTELTLFHPGRAVLKAQVRRLDGTVVAVSPSWVSSNAAVATVSANGEVATVGVVGRATITANFTTSDGIARSASAEVGVWTASLSAPNAMKAGTSAPALVQVRRPDGGGGFLTSAGLTNWKAVFETSNPAVLSASSAGEVRAVAAGTSFLRFSATEPMSGVSINGASFPPANTQVRVATGYKLSVADPVDNFYLEDASTGVRIIRLLETAPTLSMYVEMLDGSFKPISGTWSSSTSLISAQGNVLKCWNLGEGMVSFEATAPDGLPIAIDIPVSCRNH